MVDQDVRKLFHLDSLDMSLSFPKGTLSVVLRDVEHGIRHRHDV